jgi:hypothetical protein
MTYDVMRARRVRRRLFAGVAAAGVVAVTAVAVWWPGPAPEPTGAAPAAAVPEASAATAPDADPAGPTDVLPADLRWVTVAGLRLPVSATAGPADTGAGLARGFAHDPGGAVLAAVHITARTSAQVGPAVFGPTFDRQVLGADAELMRESVSRDYTQLREQAGIAEGQPLGPLAAVLRGYLVDRYSPQAAHLRVLTEAYDDAGRPVQAVTRLQMVWTGTDWALQAPPGGSYHESVTAATAGDVAAVRPFAGRG